MSQEELLKQLPHPVYFVTQNPERWQDLINRDNVPSIEQIYDRLIGGDDVWCVQTYVQLKWRGLNVYLVPDYSSELICITLYDNLKHKKFAFNSYIVACQQDRGRPEICEQRIVQNPLNVIDQTDHLLPLWPQPNIIERDKSRGTKVENLAFKGLERHLSEPFKNPEFLHRLESIGMSLSVSSEDRESSLGSEWSNYSNVDLVLAVRNCNEHLLSVKPASKLINAWLAGCPAILGPEPAYQHLRESELDYIEVRTPDEVISALVRLKNNPALYSAMVENGLKRAKDFTPDAIALRWRDLLAGPIAEGYERWLNQSPIQKFLGRPTQFVWRAIKHRRENRIFHKNKQKI